MNIGVLRVLCCGTPAPAVELQFLAHPYNEVLQRQPVVPLNGPVGVG